MLTCHRHVEETVVSVTRPHVGGSVSSRNTNNGRLPHGLGSGHEWLMSGHLTWHINCLEMLAVFQALKQFLPDLRGHRVLVHTDNTSVVSYINRQGGLYRLARQILSVGPGETALPECSVHPWAPQSGSRHPVETGAEARGMEAPHRGDGADLEEVWSVIRGDTHWYNIISLYLRPGDVWYHSRLSGASVLAMLNMISH